MKFEDRLDKILSENNRENKFLNEWLKDWEKLKDMIMRESELTLRGQEEDLEKVSIEIERWTERGEF